MIKSKFERLKRLISNPDMVRCCVGKASSLLSYYMGKGYSFYPATIFISVNSQCNLTCRMCDVGQKQTGTQFYRNLKTGTELTLDRLKSLVDEVKSFSPLIAIISTEPLLYKDLLGISNYVSSAGLELQITTNGLLLEKFADSLVRSGLQQLWVSLDGPPAVHDSIRGLNGSFEKAHAGIQLVNGIKKKTNKTFPKVHINYSISDGNYHCLVEFMKAVKDLGLESVTFSHLNYITNSMAKDHNKGFGHICKATPSCVSVTDPLKVEPSILKKQIDIVKAKYSNKCLFGPELDLEGIEAFYHKPEIFVNGNRCFVPWNVAQIIANGDLITMTRCFDIVLGNIYEQSFKEIWNGGKYRDLRKTLRKYGTFPACSRCCGIL